MNVVIQNIPLKQASEAECSYEAGRDRENHKFVVAQRRLAVLPATRRARNSQLK